ncbi:DUF805 domain-containing protein [Pediococcus parvulus]|uniref:DUF805 domain-containing protein n=1 Tax=Pediococcus parvulus TaxID=54062 RepID=UPI00345F0A3F
MSEQGKQFCIKCGKEIIVGAEFCSQCGARQSEFQATQTNLTNKKLGLKGSLNLFFDDLLVTNTRMNRANYWWAQLGLFLMSFIISFVVGFFGGLTNYSNLYFFLWFFASVYYVIIAIGGISASIRRLHDTGKSGWLFLLNLIPLIGYIALIILYCQPSIMKEEGYQIAQ